MKSVGASLKQAMPTPDQDYETESHLNKLTDAGEILSDPLKLKKIHKLAGRKHKALMGLIEPAMKGSGPVKSMSELKERAGQSKGVSDHDQDD